MASSISNYSPFNWMSTVALQGVDISSNVFNFICSKVRNVFSAVNSYRERRETARQEENTRREANDQAYEKFKSQLPSQGSKDDYQRIKYKKQFQGSDPNEDRFLQEFEQNDKNKPHPKPYTQININAYTIHDRIREKEQVKRYRNTKTTTTGQESPIRKPAKNPYSDQIEQLLRGEVMHEKRMEFIEIITTSPVRTAPPSLWTRLFA